MADQDFSYHYLVHIQYLGFRYHGWQKQPGVKTIEGMIEKTLRFVLGDLHYKLLGASRTDAKVSANHSVCMLFLKCKFDLKQLKILLNQNLPNDIRVLDIEEKDPCFNIISSPKIKEYLYLFSCGGKCHPFCASLMHVVQDELDIELMQQGATLFEGKHHFIRYCTKPSPGTQVDREILLSRIERNTEFTASFFPDKTYLYRVRAKGFLRNQIRLIMGQLFILGQGRIDLESIQQSLNEKAVKPFKEIAPASGLILNQIVL